MRGTTRTTTEDEDGDNDEMTGGEGVKSLVTENAPKGSLAVDATGDVDEGRERGRQEEEEDAEDGGGRCA